MSAKFKFYLDDNLLNDEPIGWDDVTSEIVRDFDIHGLLVQTKATLTFTGDGYDYVNCIYNSTSFCNEIRVRIEEQCSEDGQYELVFNGLIKIPDISFDLNKCTCKAPIIDNSYFARIKNNKDIEAFPHVGKTKNGTDITAPSAEAIVFFDPTTGGFVAPAGVDPVGYRVFNILKFLVQFDSDDELGFASTFFDVGGEQQYLYITNGKHLSSTVAADAQDINIGKLSLQKMLDEMYKLFNLGFIIDTTGAKPIFRLEKASYFYGSAITDVLQNANGVVKKVKTDQLYAQVNFGSDKTDNDSRLSFLEDVDLIGFKDESLQITGQCNIDKTLDLKGEFIRSSNVIEDILMGITASPQDSYDEDFILVECHVPNILRAKQFDIFHTGVLPFFYNGNLTNYNVALNFLGSIPQSLVKYISTTDNRFLASDTNLYAWTLFPSNFVFRNPDTFNDDSTPPNFDANGNYNNAIYEYTSTINGILKFNVKRKVNYKTSTATNFYLWSYIDVYDSGGFGGGNLLQSVLVEQKTIYILAGTSPATGIIEIDKNVDINISQGQIAVVRTAIGYFSVFPGAEQYQILSGSFSCLTAGEVQQTFNPEDFKAVQYTFDYPISYSRFKTIKANPKDILAFNIDGISNYEPWIETLKYNHRTTRAQLTLLGRQQITEQDCSGGHVLREDGSFVLREDGGYVLRETN